MITLQRELAEKRRAEARTALIGAARAEIWSHLERLKLHAVTGGTRTAGAAV